MSTRTNLNYGQFRGATPPPSRPTSSHASARPMNSAVPVHAAGAHPMNPQLHIPPVPAMQDEAFQTAIQKHLEELSDEDKAAFLSAPQIIDRLQEMQCNGKSLIPSSLTTRVENVLQCVKHFMDSLGIFIQHHPDISSLVVGAVNCILTVSASSTFWLFIFYKPGPNILLLSSLFWDTSSFLIVSLE